MSDDRKDASQEEIAWALEKAQELEERFDKGIGEAQDAKRRLQAGKRNLAAFVERLESGERISLDFISQGVTKFSKELPIEKSKKKAEDIPDTLYCSFCGKSQHEVKKLIAGPTVFICDECIELCTNIIAEDLWRTGPNGVFSLPPALGKAGLAALGRLAEQLKESYPDQAVAVQVRVGQVLRIEAHLPDHTVKKFKVDLKKPASDAER